MSQRRRRQARSLRRFLASLALLTPWLIVAWGPGRNRSFSQRSYRRGPSLGRT